MAVPLKSKTNRTVQRNMKRQPVFYRHLLLVLSCQTLFCFCANTADGKEPEAKKPNDVVLARYKSIVRIRDAVELGKRRQYRAALTVLDSVDEGQRHREHRFLKSYFRSLSAPSAGPVVTESLSLERIIGDTNGRVSTASFDHRYVCLQTTGGGLGLWNRQSDQIHALVIPIR